jgi:hypothetical protein
MIDHMISGIGEKSLKNVPSSPMIGQINLTLFNIIKTCWLMIVRINLLNLTAGCFFSLIFNNDYT